MPDESSTPSATSIGILGGTGKLGAGLALRWAAAGLPVTIGSRDPERAAKAASDLRAALPPGSASLEGAGNAVASGHPVVVAAIPTDGAADLVAGLADQLAGTVLVSALSPLAFDGRGPRPATVDGAASAAELLATTAPGAKVVAGFHTVSAVTLRRADEPLDEDVLLCGDDEAAVAVVTALVDDHLEGARAVHCGPLRLAATLESLTAVLISVNKRHRSHAGLRVTRL
ncbi:NADPH-dependent F420 reductase [Nitriliruptor alkaliphilus]|uniref:NADPH-dependent F420 reductase n=1 Tax=Nitriliruptor alkaliphilus TaxID=427918 RepID=UPI0006985407|nr:NADPH-dependent F420 reductase [Nitriliruptor alkaliphilus]